jgi:hypothetical protein
LGFSLKQSQAEARISFSRSVRTFFGFVTGAIVDLADGREVSLVGCFGVGWGVAYLFL